MCFQYYDENRWGPKPSGEGTRREEEKRGREETGKRRESLVRREGGSRGKATRERVGAGSLGELFTFVLCDLAKNTVPL